MIPKIIHSVWVGGKEKPKLVKYCEKSWRKYCKDYEFIEWNEDNFNLEKSPLYVREAYKLKKWAFVSDYIRLWALYHYGGVYLDSDMELINNIDCFLDNIFFSGFEDNRFVAAGILGSMEYNNLIKELMEYYEVSRFIKGQGNIDTTTIVQILTKKLEVKGLIYGGKEQLMDNGLKIYSSTFFYPKSFLTGIDEITKNTYTIHHYSGSWLSSKQKLKINIGRFLRKNNLSKLISYIKK